MNDLDMVTLWNIPSTSSVSSHTSDMRMKHTSVCALYQTLCNLYWWRWFVCCVYFRCWCWETSVFLSVVRRSRKLSGWLTMSWRVSVHRYVSLLPLSSCLIPLPGRLRIINSSAVRIFEISNRIVTSVFDSIRNEYNYSKFSNTWLPSLISYLKKLKKASFLTELCQFFTLATTPSSQQNQCYIGPLWPTKYWNSYNRNHNSAVP